MGTVTPDVAPQMGKLWAVLAAPYPGGRGPALWDTFAGDSVSQGAFIRPHLLGWVEASESMQGMGHLPTCCPGWC